MQEEQNRYSEVMGNHWGRIDRIFARYLHPDTIRTYVT